MRAYGFLAQVMSWTDRDLEALYLYARMLATKLPPHPASSCPSSPTPWSSRTCGPRPPPLRSTPPSTPATTPPGRLYPGRAGQQNDPPRERLSVLIDTLNERFGMNLTDADKVWFEQRSRRSGLRPGPRRRAEQRPRPIPDLPRGLRQGRDHRPPRSQRTAVQRLLHQTRLRRRPDGVPRRRIRRAPQ